MAQRRTKEGTVDGGQQIPTDELPDTQEAQLDQEEIQRLMNLTLSQIEDLPQEKKELVWRELARQIVFSPRFEDEMNTIMEAGRRVTAATDGLELNLRQMIETPGGVMESIRGAINNLLSDDTQVALQTWKTLAPYIADEDPEKWEDASASDLIAAAAHKARADGKDIPPLKAEAEVRERNRRKNIAKEETQQSRNKRTSATKTGALTTIGQRLFVPTDPEFQNAFASRLKSEIGIFVIETLTSLKFRDNGLQLSFLDNGISDLIDANKKTGARPLKDADTGFLRAMAKAAYRTRLHSDSMVTSFYLPAFCDELEIQGEHGTAIGSRAAAREKEILGRIESMDNVWGKLPSKDRWWKVFSILGYDRETEVVTVAMPYFNQLLIEIERKQQRQLEAGEKYYIGLCDLLHASAANERNQAAVELAARVLIGVQHRGGTPDANLKQNRHKHIEDKTICTWHITCAGLIDECPQILDKVMSQKTTGGRNKAMQRAFSTMYKVLRKKSDLFVYYNNVMITEVIPTTKTLSAEIIVQYHGYNPDYQRPRVVFDEAQEEE